MVCWSCQRDAGDGPLCAACGAVQPVRPDLDLFQVLGLPRSFFLAPAALEERFKDLNRKLHPDRFAQKAPRERRMSLEWTTRVNDAYRTLKDAQRRAAYLVKLHGIDVEKETGPAAMKRLPPEFLAEALEDREALEEAKARKALDDVRKLGATISARSERVQEELTAALQRFEASADRASLEKAASLLAILKYFSRFQEEVEAIEMAALE